MNIYSGNYNFQSGLFGFILLLIIIVALWKIFEKAGKPGWVALIPIYNIVVLLEIVGKPIWWVFLFFIPVVNVVVSIWTANLLAQRFGKSALFTVGLVLLPFIFYCILGFGKAHYRKPLVN